MHFTDKSDIVTVTTSSLQGTMHSLSTTSSENQNNIEEYKMTVKSLSLVDSESSCQLKRIQQ